MLGIKKSQIYKISYENIISMSTSIPIQYIQHGKAMIVSFEILDHQNMVYERSVQHRSYMFHKMT